MGNSFISKGNLQEDVPYRCGLFLFGECLEIFLEMEKTTFLRVTSNPRWQHTRPLPLIQTRLVSLSCQMRSSCFGLLEDRFYYDAREACHLTNKIFETSSFKFKKRKIKCGRWSSAGSLLSRPSRLRQSLKVVLSHLFFYQSNLSIDLSTLQVNCFVPFSPLIKRSDSADM